MSAKAAATMAAPEFSWSSWVLSSILVLAITAPIRVIGNGMEWNGTGANKSDATNVLVDHEPCRSPGSRPRPTCRLGRGGIAIGGGGARVSSISSRQRHAAKPLFKVGDEG